MGRSTPLRTWSHEPLDPAVRLALERLARRKEVARVAAMPDVHLAKAVCVGAVVATRDALLPAAVGGDIGCGMAAIRLSGTSEVLTPRERAAKVLAMIGERIPVAQRPSASAALPVSLAERALSAPALERKKRSVARVQFSTLGRGNHFVELQRDEEDRLWLMLHSGSRGIGQAIRDHHGGGRPLEFLPAGSARAESYLRDHQWALDYARASRREMVELVCEGLRELGGVTPVRDSLVDCHHNFVRLEEHGGGQLWVHRKGAISAREGEPGIIPGSMGSLSFHVTGRGDADSLCSSSHGAGRVMSRTEARRVVSTRSLQEQMQGVVFDPRLAARLRDEAPSAYKDIGNVMRAQRKLTRIVRRLSPLLVYKGG